MAANDSIFREDLTTTAIPAAELLAMAKPALDRAGEIGKALLASCNPSAPSLLIHELFYSVSVLTLDVQRSAVEFTTLRAMHITCERSLIWLRSHAPHASTTP